jgi:predicted nuclease of restriction endonuclease-like (RecB) superfamily
VFYNYLLKCFVLIDMKKLGPQLGTDVSKTSALEIKQGPSVAQGIGIGL